MNRYTAMQLLLLILNTLPDDQGTKDAFTSIRGGYLELVNMKEGV